MDVESRMDCGLCVVHSSSKLSKFVGSWFLLTVYLIITSSIFFSFPTSSKESWVMADKAYFPLIPGVPPRGILLHCLRALLYQLGSVGSSTWCVSNEFQPILPFLYARFIKGLFEARSSNLMSLRILKRKIIHLFVFWTAVRRLRSTKCRTIIDRSLSIIDSKNSWRMFALTVIESALLLALVLKVLFVSSSLRQGDAFVNGSLQLRWRCLVF